MIVSDVQNKSTSASLGAQDTLKVSMVQDAAFLMMLSSNLYSNQLLAAIREPLCNGWDAHIEAGKTNVPIKIIISDTGELTIIDSGFGIPKDKIAEIYGTYGQSTKRTNNQVTGGFGLGSKSPWALVDAFRVISEHDGVKTVYNMARSVVENDGLPGITPMVDAPTKRSGLTVSFRLEMDQIETAIQYIEKLVLHGEMLVDLTTPWSGETRLETLGMSFEPGSWNMDYHKWYSRYMGDHRIFVRYGAVVYPILQTENIRKAYDVITDFMDIIQVPRILVQAEPGTLALTPSREALSSQKMTEDGVTDLCVQLVDTLEAEIKRQIPGAIADACKKMREGEFDHSVPRFNSRAQILPTITNRPVRMYLQTGMGGPIFAKHLPKLHEAEHAGFIRIAKDNCDKWNFLVPQFIKLRKTVMDKGPSATDDIHALVMKNTVGRLHRAFRDLPFANARNIKLAFRSWSDYTFVDDKRHYDMTRRFSEKPEDLMCELANQVVVIGPRIKGANRSISDWSNTNQRRTELVWFLKLDSDKDADVCLAVDKLNAMGFKVVNLFEKFSWDSEYRKYKERAEAAAEKAAKAKAKREAKAKNAIACIQSYLITGHRSWLPKSNITSLENPTWTTDKPKFYVELDQVNCLGTNVTSLVRLSDLTDQDLMEGVLVRNGIERRMAVNRGAVAVDEYMAPRFVKALMSKEYMRYISKERQKDLADKHDISSQDIKLFAKLGIPLPGLDKLRYDKKMERIREITLEYLRPHVDEETYAELCKIRATRLSAELPLVKKLRCITRDPMLRALGYHTSIHQWIDQYPERLQALKSLVLSALKNGKTKS